MELVALKFDDTLFYYFDESSSCIKGIRLNLLSHLSVAEGRGGAGDWENG